MTERRARSRAQVCVGVISDTHGLLRPQALDALRGSDVIVHAGDVGDPAIVDALRALAPVTVVRGNNDRGAWAAAWPDTAELSVGNARIHVIHDLHELAVDPVATGIDVVVSGHSHRPAVTRRDGVVYVNPGSAGPRRFTLPIAVARIDVDGAAIDARIIELRP